MSYGRASVFTFFHPYFLQVGRTSQVILIPNAHRWKMGDTDFSKLYHEADPP